MTRSRGEHPVPLKVSVVVPVHDPGPDIDRCISSLLTQSLPATDFEAIFVDDGSTDGTGERLDALAAEHRHLRVIHIEPSGWPGRPRNVGIQAGRGEYVQLVDQDDHLAPEALERVWAMGHQNSADIVIGKVTSDFRAVPFELFRRDRPLCTFEDAPLTSSMTAHKLFRRAFLLERDIRFPEGRFVLEDHLFMVRAYARAERVSILASYPCYFYLERRHGRNTGSKPVDPEEYFAQMGRVVAEAMEPTVPVALRDRLVRRYHREMLGRLGDGYHRQDPSLRPRVFAAIRQLDDERFRDEDQDELPYLHRVRSALLRADRPEAIDDLSAATDGIVADVRLDEARWDAGTLRLTLRGGWRHGQDGSALELIRRGAHLGLDPRLARSVADPDGDLSAHVSSFKARGSIRREADAVEWAVGTKSDVELATVRALDDGGVAVTPRFSITVRLDPAGAAAGEPLAPGRWQLRIRASGLGLDRAVDVRASEAAAVASMTRGFGPVPRVARLTAAETVVLDVSDVQGLAPVLVHRATSAAMTAQRRLRRAIRPLVRRAPPGVPR